MIKTKLFSIFCFIGLLGIILSNSNQFLSEAQTEDVFEEIAEYKTWAKLTDKPIAVKIDQTSLVGG